MTRFDNILTRFDTYKLEEEKAISLMKRIDKKYVFRIDQLESILLQAIKTYKRLDTVNSIIPSYNTTYYDTEDFLMYTAHHNGKLNRYKLRSRKYVGSKLSFLEVKFKNNKKVTDKTRIRRLNNDIDFSKDEKAFISEYLPYNTEGLRVSLNTTFKRITLSNFNTGERITLDGDLEFKLYNKSYSPDNLIICEVKKAPGKHLTEFEHILSSFRIKAFRLSKYCLGNYYLNNKVKHNLYKEKAIYINKITKIK